MAGQRPPVRTHRAWDIGEVFPRYPDSAARNRNRIYLRGKNHPSARVPAPDRTGSGRDAPDHLCVWCLRARVDAPAGNGFPVMESSAANGRNPQTVRYCHECYRRPGDRILGAALLRRPAAQIAPLLGHAYVPGHRRLRGCRN